MIIVDFSIDFGRYPRHTRVLPAHVVGHPPDRSIAVPPRYGYSTHGGQRFNDLVKFYACK